MTKRTHILLFIHVAQHLKAPFFVAWQGRVRKSLQLCFIIRLSLNRSSPILSLELYLVIRSKCLLTLSTLITSISINNPMVFINQNKTSPIVESKWP